MGLQGELRIINLKTKKTIKSIFIEKNIKLNRINDGKTDPSGRLWFGTMDNLERNIEKGSLYCLDKNLNLNKVDTNYMITNGPAFLNSNIFYHTDSRKRTIYKIRIDKKLRILNKKVFNKIGKRIHKINLPAKNITNCAFGGKKNSELFVTSALKGMKTSEIKKYKFSGRLFKIQTNIRGIEQKKYNVRL